MDVAIGISSTTAVELDFFGDRGGFGSELFIDAGGVMEKENKTFLGVEKFLGKYWHLVFGVSGLEPRCV